ncbi:hypothetical protein PG984_002514 [Apiospora sp. TS-2023a]
MVVRESLGFVQSIHNIWQVTERPLCKTSSIPQLSPANGEMSRSFERLGVASKMDCGRPGIHETDQMGMYQVRPGVAVRTTGCLARHGYQCPIPECLTAASRGNAIHSVFTFDANRIWAMTNQRLLADDTEKRYDAELEFSGLLIWGRHQGI